MRQKDTIETLDKITRVEVIDDYGRAYVGYTLHSVKMSIQDDGRTLKLFVSKKLKKRWIMYLTDEILGKIYDYEDQIKKDNDIDFYMHHSDRLKLVDGILEIIQDLLKDTLKWKKYC